jgi:hypothetical protein
MVDALKTNTIQTYTNVKQNNNLKMNCELKFKANEMKKGAIFLTFSVIFII